MKRFAQLYSHLDASASTAHKVAAMRAYFAQAPAADAAWGLFFLLGNRLKRVVPPSRLRLWLVEETRLPASVVEESYAHVGDLAETIALLLDPGADAPHPPSPPSLHDCVGGLLGLAGQDEALQRAHVAEHWRELPFLESFVFNKLLTGSLRVGVSAGLAARALAAHAGLDTPLMQARLMGAWTPSADAFIALTAKDGAETLKPGQPYPFCLASPLEDPAESLGPLDAFLAEWKWDGIRGQLIRRHGQTFLLSRGDELLNGRFPEIEQAASRLPEGTVLDGEVLAWNAEGVMPFSALQQRIGRKTPGRKTLAESPVIFLAYDLLEREGRDWRERPLSKRRAGLETCGGALDETALRVSPKLAAEDWTALAALREEARERGVEGLMLKRLDSPYVAGRKRGVWWKWKVGAMSVDTVLIYAQSGHGRRSNLYTDYTLAVWQGDALVPVAKAYSGLTDAELTEMDRWIRTHTREKFGPVRSVEPLQVFEIAFEGIAASTRHKAGVALRFPRIARWRRDKTAAQADRLEDLQRLIR